MDFMSVGFTQVNTQYVIIYVWYTFQGAVVLLDSSRFGDVGSLLTSDHFNPIEPVDNSNLTGNIAVLDQSEKGISSKFSTRVVNIVSFFS